MTKILRQILKQDAEMKLLKLPIKKRRKNVGIIAFHEVGAHLGELGNQAGPACQDLIWALQNKLKNREPLQSELLLAPGTVDSVHLKRPPRQMNQLNFW